MARRSSVRACMKVHRRGANRGVHWRRVSTVPLNLSRAVGVVGARGFAHGGRG